MISVLLMSLASRLRHQVLERMPVWPLVEVGVEGVTTSGARTGGGVSMTFCSRKDIVWTDWYSHSKCLWVEDMVGLVFRRLGVQSGEELLCKLEFTHVGFCSFFLLEFLQPLEEDESSQNGLSASC